MVNSIINPHGSKLLQLELLNYLACDFLTSLGYDGARLRISAPRRGAKKYDIAQPQSKERIELLRKAKTAGALFAVTHNKHLSSSDFFKAGAMDDRKKLSDAMLKDKRTRFERQKLRQKAMAILSAHGEPTPEKIKDYTAPAMQKLYEWKFNKKSMESREKLLKAYLSAPIPLKDPDWSTSEEIKLKELLTEDMYAKDTALGVQLKQTVNAITNNINDLDNGTHPELLCALQLRKEDESEGDNQRRTL